MTSDFNRRFSLSQQIEEVEREITLRKRVYPGLVRRGKMSQDKADFHIDRMEQVLATLEHLAGNHDGHVRHVDR
jgi:hypothetical protein